MIQMTIHKYKTYISMNEKNFVSMHTYKIYTMQVKFQENIFSKGPHISAWSLYNCFYLMVPIYICIVTVLL